MGIATVPGVRKVPLRLVLYEHTQLPVTGPAAGPVVLLCGRELLERCEPAVVTTVCVSHDGPFVRRLPRLRRTTRSP
jgi:hypothetical protein